MAAPVPDKVFYKHGDLYFLVGNESAKKFNLVDQRMACYKVSSHAVAHFSPVWEVLLYGGFAESRPTDGSPWIVSLPEDDLWSMGVLLDAAHDWFRDQDKDEKAKRWAKLRASTSSVRCEPRRRLHRRYWLTLTADKYDVLDRLKDVTDFREWARDDHFSGRVFDDDIGLRLWTFWRLGAQTRLQEVAKVIYNLFNVVLEHQEEELYLIIRPISPKGKEVNVDSWPGKMLEMTDAQARIRASLLHYLEDTLARLRNHRDQGMTHCLWSRPEHRSTKNAHQRMVEQRRCSDIMYQSLRQSLCEVELLFDDNDFVEPEALALHPQEVCARLRKVKIESLHGRCRPTEKLHTALENLCKVQSIWFSKEEKDYLKRQWRLSRFE